MLKLVIDTDPGVDDAMALFFAMLHKDIELLGLTTIFGNVTQDKAVRNALVLGDIAGQDIPVARGADKPSVIPPNPPADFVHGQEGFGDLPAFTPKRSPDPRTAAQFIVDTANAHQGELVLCPVGPLTNIATALELDPELPSKVKQVVIMGGGVERGNVTPYAEANVWNDPHAADKVFAANWPMRMIGLNVTMDTVCSKAMLEATREAAPKLGGFLCDAADFYMRFYGEAYGIDGCQMHDPAALVACVAPELFTYKDIALEVSCQGETIGQTRPSKASGRRSVQVAMQVDSDRVNALFLDTIKTGF